MADDWFAQFSPAKPAAPSAPAGGDFFAQFEPVKVPAAAKPATSWYDSLTTFLDRATKPIQPAEINKMVQAVNPLLMTGDKSFAQSMAERTKAGAHPHAAFAQTLLEWRPVAAAKGILEAQGKLGADAQQDFAEGRIGDGVVKAAHYLLPMFGPGMQKAGEEIQRGNVAAGLGDTAAIAGSIVAPALVKPAIGAVTTRINAAKARGGVRVTPTIGSNLPPAEQAALEYAQTQGVPVPGSTLTGNAFLKGVDATTESASLAGAAVGGKARAAREAGLATLGEQLASKANQQPKALAEIAAERGELLHGSSATFPKFDTNRGHGAIYLSDPGDVNWTKGRTTQAEHIAGGPFGGNLYAVKVDPSKLKRFDPLNDPQARAIYEQVLPGKPVRQWVDYEDMPDIVAAAKGYSDFAVREPSIQGTSRAITNPDAMTITSRVAKGADGKFTQMSPGSAVTKEAAGQGLDKAIRKVAAGHGTDADYAYQTLRAYEADPAKARTFEIARNPDKVTGEALPPATSFAPRNAPKGAVFDGVYADAVKQGWTGTKQELRTAFEARVGQAKDLGGELRAAADDFSDEALLREVRKMGLRPALKEGAGGTTVRGDFAPLVDTFRTGKWRQGGAASVFRKDGYPLDELVQRLNQDPRFVDMTPADLMTRLGDIAAKGPSAPKMDLEGLLQAVDVRPGAKWWDADAVAADRAMAGDIGAALDGKHLVRTETVPLGVDLRASKQALQPLYDQLKRESELVNLMGAKGSALTSLDRLMSAPEVAPLSVVDGALGELKSALRKGRRDGFLTEGQAATAQTVKQLEDAVQAAAHEAGPEVVEALRSGRASTIAKYDALDVLDLLKDEPVGTIRMLTAPKGGNLGKLRDVARLAPEEMPKVGRAWLDEQLATATERGGFAHADKLFADWQKLDGPTKQLIFRDPAYIKELDHFFLAAKKISENVNPSGSAKTYAAATHMGSAALAAGTGHPLALLGNLGVEVGGYAFQKLMHTRTGVKLLTEGLRIPAPTVGPAGQQAATAAVRAKVVADLARFAGPEWYRNPVFAEDEERTQP